MPRNLAAALAAAAFLLAALPIVKTASASQDAAPAPPSVLQQMPPQAGQRRPMPKPTNLKVFPKDIAVPDLLATMRGFTKALGVECQFCHVSGLQTPQPNFASDANPDKGIARIMITMTREINAKYLSQVNDPDATPADKTVTCGTCHRGNSMPAPFVAVAAMEEPQGPPAPPEKKPQ